MAQPVWVLSVDLQTKSATFVSGMGDAAKAARGSFNDIKQGAGEMGRDVGRSMGEARHGVMFLAESFDAHLPRALAGFIASLGPVGAVMEAAFPFLAIVIGAKLLIEHLVKVHEEAEKLTRSQEAFHTAADNAFNALDQKILQAEIKTDELNKDHLGALKHELELINRQSMDELVHTFDIVAKAADEAFKHIHSHMYTAGVGAEGAKNALEEFKVSYAALLAKGDEKGARDLLAGTLESAEKTLAMQKQLKAHRGDMAVPGVAADPSGDAYKYLKAHNASTAATEDEITAQQILIDALHDQVQIQGKIAELKKDQTGNATRITGNAVTDEHYRQMKAQMDQDRAAEEQEQKDWEERHNKAIARLETGEREKIEATRQGSAARLQAIDAAMKDEEKYGLQETSFYHSLGVQRVETVRQMAEEEGRIRAEAGREAAQHSQKMGELQLAAEREADRLRLSAHHVTERELIALEVEAANEEHQIQLDAINQQIRSLDKSDKDYANKLRALQNRQEEQQRQHENKITEIKDKAAIERNARMLAADNKMRDEIAQGLASVIMRHQSFASMMGNIGDQIASGMSQNAIKSMLAMDMTKEKEAAAAARKAFLAGWDFPFPVNIVAAPAMGAAAFAAVMAFEKGGMVPGVGRGDIVPAMLTPGEAVLPKAMTEMLTNAARSGSTGGGHRVQIHYRPTYHVNTIDGDGIRGVLRDHAGEFHQHFETTIRKMNQ